MPDSHPLSDWQLHCARRTIFSGGVIAYPTEAVWGLGCDPWDQEAVERILELKQRPVEKGVILVASSVDQIRFLLEPLSQALQDEAERYWPGPVTCLLPDVERQIPEWVRGKHTSIAVRVSEHPVVGACATRRECPWFPPPATRQGASRPGISGRSGAISAISLTGSCPAHWAVIANPAVLLILSAVSNFVRSVYATATR